MARWFVFAFSLAVAAGPLSAADDVPPDFNRDVRPILSAHCFKCHGPDDKTREAGLRLDLHDAATKELDSGATAIVGGQPAASELVRRILSTDDNEIMPPPAANKALSAEQKLVLERWIAAGAKYDPHWSFVRPTQVAPPIPRKLKDAPGSTVAMHQPIDAFILARLHAAGLAPAPSADRYTLVRRVYLDLIGLPPSIDEADAFVQDTAPDAYERLVDRLLASPHYGERWARRWLDLARYADTNGYEKDRLRTMWTYRDWVIRAINAGQPFDEFTIDSTLR